MTTRIQEVYGFVASQFEANNIEDTPENRYHFLHGLLEGWEQVSCSNPQEDLEKSMYTLAVKMELTLLRFELMTSALYASPGLRNDFKF